MCAVQLSNLLKQLISLMWSKLDGAYIVGAMSMLVSAEVAEVRLDDI